MGTFLLVLLLALSLFLMLVILIQRGRGGGLAGAFGGLGGQSAFGTKAGDVFTVITIVTAVLWVSVACLAGWRIRVESEDYFRDRGPEVPAAASTGEGVPTADGDATGTEEQTPGPSEEDSNASETDVQGAKAGAKQPAAGQPQDSQ
ncbi:MAG: preprotein translocase subunit SecG [Planctomycetaceae bacterium]